jgi:hypothetical protein
MDCPENGNPDYNKVVGDQGKTAREIYLDAFRTP